ncbi:hypothetical protein OPQ81_006963 [Rhizoctonia solani]|nr:hypothetical protein OPQ81_006963 [Rhizoctonia solani]
MSLKAFCYSVYTALVVLICGVVGKILRARGVGGVYRDESGSGWLPQEGRSKNARKSEVKRAKPGEKKSKGSLNADKGSERWSYRHKIEMALPILLQAAELDNAGSLEAVGAYREAANLFDDAIGILNNGPWKPTQVAVEARLRNMRDTYRDRADSLLLDFQERVLNRKFRALTTPKTASH